MERISSLYSDWGEEIAWLTFRGGAQGKLDDSLGKIVEFLKSL